MNTEDSVRDDAFQGFSWEEGEIVASTDTQFIIRLPDNRRIKMVKYLVPKASNNKIFIKTKTFNKALKELEKFEVNDVKNAVLCDPTGFLQKFLPNFSRHHITSVKTDNTFCYVTLKAVYPVVGKIPIVFVQQWAGIPICSHLGAKES